MKIVNKSRLIYLLLTLVITFVITMTCWRLWGTDFKVPLTGYRSDSVGVLLEASNYVKGGSIFSSVEYGAPYTGEYVGGGIYDSSVPMLFISLIWRITGSVEAGINVHAILNILLLAISIYWVSQKYCISNLVSMILGISYAEAAFFLMSCNTVLLIYSACFYIPLFCYTCIELMKNNEYEQNNFTWRNIIFTILVMVYVGINSAYYAFLALIILAFVLLYTMFATRRKDKFILTVLSCMSIFMGIMVYTLPGILAGVGYSELQIKLGYGFCVMLLIASLCILLIIGFVATKIISHVSMKYIYYSLIVLTILLGIIYVFLKKYTNYIGEYGGRTWYSVELGAFRIVSMLLPTPNNIVPKLNNVVESLFEVDSADFNLMGIVAGIGYVYSMLYLFRYKSDKENKSGAREEVLHICGLLNIFMTIVAVKGGVSSLIAMYITTGIRNYNRICVFIAVTSLISCGIMIDKLLNMLKEKKVLKIIIYAVIVACLGISIPTYFVYNGLFGIPEYSQRLEEYNDWQNIMKNIENSVSEGAMIYELPYSVDYSILGDLMDEGRAYELSIPVILSKSTVWSYGGGSRASAWKNAISSDVDEMLLQISAFGFEGIYIDTLMYSDDSYKDLIVQLEDRLGEPYICNENRRYFFNMTEYNENALEKYGIDGIEKIKEDIE
jgi:hypothetical protein